ncbi:MAG: enoyl-CoA hydratase/isomerase family protein [Dehalococcoidia bacterium]
MVNEAGEPILIKEREGAILIARMNRPERLNALGGGLPEALNDAWFEFRDDPGLKVMIITGTGDRAFCAGADLRRNNEVATALGAQSAQAMLDASRAPRIGASITSNNFHLYKPIIAALNGWTLAGGCEMAMGCDFRIIEAHAQMGLPEVKRGMGAKSTTHKLSFLTYLGVGLELDWTGDPITAEHAVQIGMADEVVPTGKSLERALEIARRLAARPSTYLQYHKERMFESVGTPIAYALAMEQRELPHEGEDYRRGLEASVASPLQRPPWR